MAAISARALASLLGDWRPGEDAPLYTVLADRVRLLILDGRLAVGDRLPAERELAAQLDLSRTTVASAYGRLRELGFARSVRGSGTVAELPDRAPLPVVHPDADVLDFSSATLPAVPLVAEAARRAAEALPAHLGAPGFDLLGLPALRQAIADRYASRGVPTTADQIMVTLGAQHALALVARTVLSRGDRVLVESPTYPHAIEALRAAGGRLTTVPVTTEDGWDDDALRQAFPRTAPALAYLMPDYHNPTTRVMPDEQRATISALAAEQGTVLVIDETMAVLAFDGAAPSPRPMAAHGDVVTIGSVGKSIWGGIRLGWIRADRTVIRRLALARSAGDLGSPLLEQLVLLELLGHYDRVLDGRRALLADGHARLTAALTARFPDWQVPHVDGGLTLWVQLGAPVASALALAARDEGVLVGAGPRFGLDGAFERFLRLPFCRPEAETDRALDALERAWLRVARSGSRSPSDEPVLAAVV